MAHFILSERGVFSSIRSQMRVCLSTSVFFFQAEDGIRDLVRSRGLGDVYKRQDRSQGPGSFPFSVHRVECSCGRPARPPSIPPDRLSLIHI